MIRDSICGSCGLWHSINCDDDGKNTWGLCPNTKDAETQEYGPLRRGESAQEKHQNARKNHEERLREWVTAQQKWTDFARANARRMLLVWCAEGALLEYAAGLCASGGDSESDGCR
jgi:hypothetical protein